LTNIFHFLAKGNSMTTSNFVLPDLNGLSVGDLIYNTNREAMFVITRFLFEHPSGDEQDEHPYFLGAQVTVGERSIEVCEEYVNVTVQGSKRVTQAEVSEMVKKHVEASNNKVLALQELATMAGR